MPRVFDEILLRGIRSGKLPAREQDARDWFREQAKSVKKINDRQFMEEDTSRLKARPLIGNMFTFYYDAKHKSTLPYFDRFPLIFPFKKVKGGFYGINMHYLPHRHRAMLMDELYDITNNRNFDETTKLKIKYRTLMRVSNTGYFKPCVKRYLSSHVRSKFMYIYPSEWDVALFLPTERFQGASKTKVWADSKKAIK
jgi:hypothetical protein